ncbi:MAG: C-terminal binding protein [Spirochaetota bacterium]
MKKILFTGKRLFMKFADLDYFHRRAGEAGLRVVTVPGEDDRELIEQAADASAVVLIARNIHRGIIDAMRRCELIQTLSVGYDCVDVEHATSRGIPVSNTPAYCTDEVANHAMTLILSVARKLQRIIPETSKGVWEYAYTKPILNFEGRTLGVIGLGRIGRRIAPKARGFGMRVAAYDPYVDEDIFRLMEVRRFHELEELLREADYLTVHAPLTPETRHMLDAGAFGLMKPHAVVVNTARGSIIHEQALVEALAEGRIGGAGVDVLETEPPSPDNPLLHLDSAVVTPHIAWYSEESFKRDMEQGMNEVIRVLNGKRPWYIVNPEIFGRK